MDAKNSPEKQAQPSGSPDAQKHLIVSQPQRLEDIMAKVNAMSSPDAAELSSGSNDGDIRGASGAQTGSQQQAQMSERDLAIANLPDQGMMQSKIAEHIQDEIKLLRKEVKKSARKATKAGNAHRLNELYARIRQLNRLLAHLFESSYETVKRLFIRIFIDKQTIM